MSPPFWPRLGRTFALGVATLAADRAAAQEPPAAVPATHFTPAPPRTIDVYHGTTKIGVMVFGYVPPPPPVTPVAAVQPVVTETRLPDEVLATLRAAEENTRASRATADLLVRLEERLKVSSEPRAVFPVVYSFPAAPPPSVASPYQPAPWLTAPPAPPAVPAPAPVAPAAPAPAPVVQQQPQIVVIRESAPAEPRMVYAPPGPAAEQARGVTIGTETLLGLGVGVVGVGFGLASWLRGGRGTNPRHTPPAPPSQLAADGVLLMGKYNAGPRPAPAEKFEIGPTYQDVQEEKKRTEAESQQAVLEFILTQNLALHAELAGPDPEPAAQEPPAEAGEPATEPERTTSE